MSNYANIPGNKVMLDLFRETSLVLVAGKYHGLSQLCNKPYGGAILAIFRMYNQAIA